MMIKKIPLTLSLLACMAAVHAVQNSHHETMLKANQHLHNQQPGLAYELLLPLEDELAGTHEYDLLLGQAALLGGYKTRAAMAFERCLAVTPTSGDCRLGMAQAHLRLNEPKSAEKELRTIKQYSPPPEVAKIVNEYLELIASGHTPTASDTSRLNA